MQTKDETLELRLSLEEVVVLLNLMGHAQLAGETLRALVGPIAPDEMRGRLLAANRSLLARGIFKLAGDKLQIDPAYARLLMPLADNRFVLRCAAREPGQPEEAVTFYVRDDVVVEQRIAYDVAHTLREVADVAAASAICEAFLDLARPIPFQAAPFSLTDEQLEEARRLVAVEIEQAGVYLRDLGLDDDTNAFFVDDLAHQRRRGSAVRLEIDAVAETVRDSGFLSLVGESGRGWLFIAAAAADGPIVQIRPADSNLVRQSLEAVFAPRMTV